MRRIAALLSTLPMMMLACTTGSTDVQGGSAATGPVTNPPAVTQADLGGTRTQVLDPHVAIDGDGVVHLIWWDNTEVDGVVRHAVADAPSIGEPEVISDAMDVYTTETSVLVTPRGDVCAFFDGWLDELDLATRGYYMRCLTDGTWSEPTLVTSQGVISTFDPAFEADGTGRAVATTPLSSITLDGTELSESDLATAQAQLAIDATGAYHVVWAELGDDVFALDHRMSTDGGTTWSPIDALEGTDSFVPDPEVFAASDGSIHVFYETTLLFHRVWTAAGGWGETVVGPDCGGDYAFALAPGDVPMAACANLEGASLTTESEGRWSQLEPIAGSTDVPATAIALAVGTDGTRHVAWVTAEEPPELRYVAVPG